MIVVVTRGFSSAACGPNFVHTKALKAARIAIDTEDIELE